MLKEPYTRYSRLHTYHLGTRNLPPFDDPDLIGTWHEAETTILFFHRPKDELIAELCRAACCDIVYKADLDYADWEIGFAPHGFTEQGLTVRPVWEEGEADIRLDPSVVFGNGFHPSTRLCLRYLLSAVDSASPKISSILDLGCGTGLLSMAAAARGVKNVTAVDHNLLACKVCAANAERNRMKDSIRTLQLDLFDTFPDVAADLTVANLHHELLAHLMGQDRIWRSKYFVLSGFMPSQEEQLLPLVPHERFALLDRDRDHKWCLWLLAAKAG